MNKKGAVISILIVLGFIFAAIIYFSSDKEKGSMGYGNYLGEVQLKTLNAYWDAEEDLYYLDQIVKLSAEQSIYDLGQKGGYGFSKGSGCGNYLGYSIWFDTNKECYPKRGENILTENFFEFFNNYLAEGAENSYGYLPKENYKAEFYSEDYNSKDYYVKGSSDEDIEIDISVLKAESKFYGDKEPSSTDKIRCPYIKSCISCRSITGPSFDDAKENNFHSGFADKLEELWERNKNWRVSEGWPASYCKHVDKNHYNGKAIDVTLDNSYASDAKQEEFEELLEDIGFDDIINEYKKPSKYSTGGHFHFEWEGGYESSSGNVFGSYKVKPSFIYNTGYNFEDYDFLSEAVKECVKDAFITNVDSTTGIPGYLIEQNNVCLDAFLNSCLNSKVSSNGFVVSVTEANNYYLVDVVTKEDVLAVKSDEALKKGPLIDNFNKLNAGNKKLDFRKVVIKFGIKNDLPSSCSILPPAA